VVHTYPIEYMVAWSVPILIWAAAYALLYSLSRGGRLKVEANVLAFSGAILAFVSLLTCWGTIESGYDWSAGTSYSIFLVITYSLALLTPLAAIGQAGMLLWVMGFAASRDASIVPLYGYVIAWVSVAVMIAGIVWPQALHRDRTGSDIYDRLLTITVRHPSHPWMASHAAVGLVISVFFFAFAGLYLLFRREGMALGLIVIGLVIVWVFLSRGSREESGRGVTEPRSGAIERRCPTCGMDNPRQASHCIRCRRALSGAVAGVSARRSVTKMKAGHLAWLAHVALAYAALIIVLATLTGAFGPGYSGEEKTSILVWGAVVGAIVVASALVARHWAVPPSFPKGLVTTSVAVFALFILMASIELSGIVHTGFSSEDYLVFAGIGLVGPMLFYLQSQSRRASIEKTP